jgi:hypothetical protein
VMMLSMSVVTPDWGCLKGEPCRAALAASLAGWAGDCGAEQVVRTGLPPVTGPPVPRGWQGLVLALLEVVVPEMVQGWTRTGGTRAEGTKGCALALSIVGDLDS